MIFTKVQILFILTFKFQYSLSQDEGDEDFLSEPWVDVAPVPKVTPTYIRLNSSNFHRVKNAFDQFSSVAIPNRDTLVNTGCILIVYASPSTETYTIGGVMGLDEYKYVSIFFLWNLKLGRAGTSLNGIGTPLEVTVVLANTKYDIEDAPNHRDGFFLDVMRVAVVNGAADNPEYPNFIKKLSQVSQAGSRAIITDDDLNWMNGGSTVHNVTLCYPGQYTNYTNNLVTNSATVCLRHDNPPPTISQSQFLKSFRLLRNKANQPYSKVEPLRKASPNTPFGIFGPMIAGIAPN